MNYSLFSGLVCVAVSRAVPDGAAPSLPLRFFNFLLNIGFYSFNIIFGFCSNVLNH